MRYAGQHCLASLVSDDEKEIDNNIYEAKDHCKRAIYDAMEIGIVYLLNKIKIFNEDYKYITISDVVPEYIHKLHQINEIKSYIGETSRKDIENYEEIQKLFDQVLEIERALNSARPELNKKINNWRMGILFTLIGILIALIGILISLLK